MIVKFAFGAPMLNGGTNIWDFERVFCVTGARLCLCYFSEVMGVLIGVNWLLG